MARWGAGVLATGLAVACGPAVDERPKPEDAERFARALCEARAGCDCELRVEASVDCEPRAASLFVELTDADAEYSSECFEDMLDYLESSASSVCGFDSWDGPTCRVFEGRGRAGAACDSTSLAERGALLGSGACEAGLTCRDGACQGPLDARPASSRGKGERCTPGLPTCGTGLHCSRDGECDEDHELGEACETPLSCGAGAYCSGLFEPGDVGRCADAAEIGEACEPGVVRSCQGLPAAYCDVETSTCRDSLPVVCSAVLYQGAWDAYDWIPSTTWPLE
ncbi:MAG: hypothetical protein AAGA54_07215 [Myxococcota bacterium]